MVDAFVPALLPLLYLVLAIIAVTGVILLFVLVRYVWRKQKKRSKTS
jgi:membrane protein DedA with SNARE-associated domain